MTWPQRDRLVRDFARSAATGRPAGLLKVLLILWLLIALILILNSTMCLVLWHFGGFRERFATAPIEFPSIFRYYGVFAAAQLAGGLVLLAGAIAGLAGQRYGRYLLQIGCGVGVVFLVGFGSLSTWSFFAAPSSESHAAIFATFWVAGLITCLVLLAPPVLTIWLLGRPEVRAAFH